MRAAVKLAAAVVFLVGDGVFVEAVALHPSPSTGGPGACRRGLEGLLRARGGSAAELLGLCREAYPEAVCLATRDKLLPAWLSGDKDAVPSLSPGAICGALEAVTQGWRRSGAGAGGSAARLSAASLEESLQRKKFAWEYPTPGNSSAIDRLVDQVHRISRSLETPEEVTSERAREFSRFVTPRDSNDLADGANNPNTTGAPVAFAKVTGFMVMTISNPYEFIADPNMQALVRASIASIANAPPSDVEANFSFATFTTTDVRVDYLITVPVLSSQQVDIQSILADVSLGEVTSLISGAVDAYLGPQVYAISVVSLPAPALEIVPVPSTTGNTTANATNVTNTSGL